MFIVGYKPGIRIFFSGVILKASNFYVAYMHGATRAYLAHLLSCTGHWYHTYWTLYDAFGTCYVFLA
jgi:hypothetical protein